MTAASLKAQEESFDSVESVINELLELFGRQTDLHEDLSAKGVPLPVVQTLVDLAGSGPAEALAKQKQDALSMAMHKHGLNAVNERDLDDAIEQLKYLAEDTVFVRKMAKGMNLNPQAINMLTQIVLRNPGDRGKNVLESLLDYASACGISVQGLQAAGNQPRAARSVLPDIQILEPELEGLKKYKDILIELTIGIVVTLTALSMLT